MSPKLQYRTGVGGVGSQRIALWASWCGKDKVGSQCRLGHIRGGEGVVLPYINYIVCLFVSPHAHYKKAK